MKYLIALVLFLSYGLLVQAELETDDSNDANKEYDKSGLQDDMTANDDKDVATKRASSSGNGKIVFLFSQLY
jgi:hypothetical protein